MSKSPTRLYVGSQFTWEGKTVKITSFRDKAVIACTYKPRKKGEYGDKIDQRLRIPFADIIETRRKADALCRKLTKQITDCKNLKAIKAAGEKIAAFVKRNRKALRHFDIQTVQETFSKHSLAIRERYEQRARAKRDAIAAAKWKKEREELARTHDADLARWLAGEEMDRFFDVVKLRVKEGFVETTTHQRATVAESRKVYRFALRHRGKGWQANGEQVMLDRFPLRRVTASEVEVGCTIIEWPEIDRLAKQEGWTK